MGKLIQIICHEVIRLSPKCFRSLFLIEIYTIFRNLGIEIYTERSSRKTVCGLNLFILDKNVLLESKISGGMLYSSRPRPVR
jgi:hypothetical protein